jgi:uncharacterized coiled-coil DUF342 family protein
MDFLMKSQESLHANLDRLYETVTRHSEEMQKMDQRIDALLRAVEADGEYIRALARIAEPHQERISRLEEGERPN